MSDFSKRIAQLSPAQLEALTLRLKGKEAVTAVPELKILPRNNATNISPQSFGQQRLWILDKLKPGNPAYNIPTHMRFLGDLDVPVLEQVLSEIVRRHESLRTRFSVADDEPVQIVEPAFQVALPIIDLGHVAEDEREKEARKLGNQDARQEFDLSQAPLWRARLLRISTVDHILLFTTHHIVTDAWSLSVLLREIAQLYKAFSQGQPSPLPELPIQYSDYSIWQREWLQGEVLSRQLCYWKRTLDGAPVLLELPTDRPRPPIQTFNGARLFLQLSKELSDALVELSHRQGATLFMTLLAAFKILLYRYSHQTDIVVGSPVANRKSSDVEKLIGFFVNTVAIRTDLSSNPGFCDFLQQVRKAALEAFSHQDVPFERVVEETAPERNLSHSPLFQTVFALQNIRMEAWELPGLKLSSIEVDTGHAKFDIWVSLVNSDQGIRGRLEYNTDLFEEQTIRRMIVHLQELLKDICAAPEQRLDHISLLTANEHRQFSQWNNTAVDYPIRYVAEMFAAQVERRPEALAVEDERRRWSYGELERRSNQLARYLRGLGIGLESRVGLVLPRSCEFVEAALAVIKAGGVYVPLDPQHPAERIRFMLGDVGASVVLTEEDLAKAVAGSEARVVLLDRDESEIGAGVATSLPVEVSRENLAYIIYTSGSTGQPKGVGLSHGGLMNLVAWHQETYGVGHKDRVSQVAGQSFDASVWEIWPYLTAGAGLHIAPRLAVTSPGLMMKWLVEKEISIAFLPTPLAEAILKEEWPKNSLRYLLTGGDRLHGSAVRNGFELVNHYGPTENTVVATSGKVEAEGTGRKPPIGRPIANTEVYVLDEREQPVPVGVAGELYLSGTGLARGYWQQPSLTAEKFMPNPFSKRPGERMYRTGDLGRHLANGELEFLGRRDGQVKLRGYRIELGEIEARMREQEEVREAVVELRQREGEEARLVAYVVLREGGVEESVEKVRCHLREHLPEYMVPGAFVRLEQLPRTPNGKIDRRALPEPDVNRRDVASPYAEPQSELERRMARLWSEVLKVEQVGLHDNFFDLGGHSLLLIQVHRKLLEELGLELSVIDLFKYPTIASLAESLKPPGMSVDESEKNSQDWLIQARQRADLRRQGVKQGETDIAIIGLSGRFPSAANVAEFWENLRNGVEAVREFSEAEIRAAGVSEEWFQQDRYIRMGTVLEQLEWFDAEFFGITPREAQAMDPQQRLFLECAWQAMEDAGYDPDSYDLPIGMFAGAATNSYMFQLISNRELFRAIGGFQAKLLNDKDFLTSRVSYKLGLKGPSLTIQTACSTSLVATHLACQSLLNGECSMALAGGATVLVPQRSGYLYQEGGLLSPDGHCRPFDARAAGIVGGSGMGVILLKPLSKALADGDSIRAVIKGSAVNNDGALKVGYTAPSVSGQAAVIAEAQTVAGIHPESISYIEAHGTATKLGDPIEIAALTQAFRAQTAARQFCAIGSVKSNIGHLDAAAGVAGLIKTVLALEHEELPASLHYEKPNPEIDFAESPFYVNAQLRKWPRKEGEARRAGVSSFGMGGTNAHVILEESPAVRREKSVANNDEWQVLMLSARTADSLTKAKQQLAAHLEKHPEQELADVAYTLQVGRREFVHRAVAVCRNTVDAAAILRSNDPRNLLENVQQSAQRPVAFLFSGIGDHYVNMAAGVYASEETFRNEVNRCSELLKEHLGCDLRQLLYPPQDSANPQSEIPEASFQPLDLRRMLNRSGEQVDNRTKQLNETLVAQPVVFVIEYATARLLMQWGIKPEAMLGYSIGEYVAACLAGVLSLEDALFLVARRAQLIQTLPTGAMLAVPASEEDVQDYLSDQVWLAAINNSALCVLAGSEEAIRDCEQKIRSKDMACRKLPTTHPFHSLLLDPVAEQFTQLVKKVKLKAPKIPYLSNVTGTWITAAEAMDPNYWARHMCQTVRFADGLSELWRESCRVMIEVGPGQSLTSLALQERVPGTEQVALPTMRNSYEQQPDMCFLMGTLARLWLAGVTPDWTSIHHNKSRHRVPLPTYNFDRQYYWLPQPDGSDHRPLVQAGKKPEIASWFYLPSWRRTSPLSLLEPVNTEQERQNWLVFLDHAGIGSRIAARLEGAGHSVVRVSADGVFRVCSSWSYTLKPSRRDDYELLLGKLQEMNWNPTRVVHLWGLDIDSENLSGRELFDESQASGFYSLLYLAQALGRYGRESLQITVISDQMQEVTGQEMLRPDKATILGPCKVIPQEYPEIRCRSIDIVLPSPGGHEQEKLVQQLVAELQSDDSNEAIAFRGGYRWIQHFEPLRLDPKGYPTRLREGGVYLLIGGLGRIGITLAEYLARRTKAKLVLTGRSGLPPRDTWEEYLEKWGQTETGSRMKSALALEALNAEVCILKANVGDRDEMHKVIQETYRQFGALNGVIYLAGLLGPAVFSPIQETSQAECEPNFQAKGHGLYVLEEVLDGIDLDFCVLFSSLASVLGGLGFTAYTAANAFIDGFVRKHNRTAIRPWISENWDTWLVGHGGSHSLDFKASQSDLNMTPEEAVSAFQAILSAGQTQVVVSVGDLQTRLEKWIRHKALSDDRSGAGTARFTSHPRPGLRNAFVAPRDEMEQDIAEIWQEVLGIQTIGIYDNFFELGGHSLLGTQIISRIRKKFHEDISVRTIFTSPTIADLAETIIQRRAEQVDSATLTQLISEVRQLAD